MDQLLEANLVEHRIEAALDAPSAERFTTITARTLLVGGTKSPAIISQQLVTELAEAIPEAAIAILPGLDHLAPQHQPDQIATAILAARSAKATPSARANDAIHDPDSVAARPATAALSGTSNRLGISPRTASSHADDANAAATPWLSDEASRGAP